MTTEAAVVTMAVVILPARAPRAVAQAQTATAIPQADQTAAVANHPAPMAAAGQTAAATTIITAEANHLI